MTLAFPDGIGNLVESGEVDYEIMKEAIYSLEKRVVHV